MQLFYPMVYAVHIAKYKPIKLVLIMININDN